MGLAYNLNVSTGVCLYGFRLPCGPVDQVFLSSMGLFQVAFRSTKSHLPAFCWALFQLLEVALILELPNLVPAMSIFPALPNSVESSGCIAALLLLRRGGMNVGPFRAGQYKNKSPPCNSHHTYYLEQICSWPWSRWLSRPDPKCLSVIFLLCVKLGAITSAMQD